jgi:hypothetical protein
MIHLGLLYSGLQIGERRTSALRLCSGYHYAQGAGIGLIEYTPLAEPTNRWLSVAEANVPKYAPFGYAQRAPSLATLREREKGKLNL